MRDLVLPAVQRGSGSQAWSNQAGNPAECNGGVAANKRETGPVRLCLPAADGEDEEYED